MDGEKQRRAELVKETRQSWAERTDKPELIRFTFKSGEDNEYIWNVKVDLVYRSAVPLDIAKLKTFLDENRRPFFEIETTMFTAVEKALSERGHLSRVNIHRYIAA
jgi:hypothetical protein